jgi:hypothetical protein
MAIYTGSRSEPVLQQHHFSTCDVPTSISLGFFLAQQMSGLASVVSRKQLVIIIEVVAIHDTRLLIEQLIILNVLCERSAHARAFVRAP